VQVVGGCCGIEIEHTRPLRDALPTHLPWLLDPGAPRGGGRHGFMPPLAVDQ
jgi:hypothetical protein